MRLAPPEDFFGQMPCPHDGVPAQLDVVFARVTGPCLAVHER